jgi:hypothetical protein
MSVLSVIAALALLLVAAFTQWQLPRFTRGRRGVMLARSVLIAVGAAFGALLARQAGAGPETTAGGGAAAILAFLHGFGLVHLPAAVVLVLKRARGERPS